MSITRFAALLSSSNCKTISLFSNTDHKSKAGKPAHLTPASADTISASGVLWLTAVCLLDWAVKGARLLRPLTQRNIPDVDLLVLVSPAKSASQNNLISKSLGSSPT